jgi:serine phosphatase RsbU (regulator of sigma subunit)/ketosteroid isomerase-like protein
VSREDALALVWRLLKAARSRDLAEVRDCYAEDAVAESPALGEIRGRDNIVASWGRLFSSFSNITVDVSTVLVDGDRVAVLGRLTTSDLPSWFGRASLGVPISYRLVLLFTIAGGRVVHDQRIYDSAGLLERLEKVRIDQELETAAEVQRALQSRTAAAGSFYQSVGHSVPCRAIGGDFFDFIDLPSGSLGIVMGDVAGKGPAAALLAALIQGMLESDVHADGPAGVLTRVNRRLIARDFGARFATLVYAVLSPDGRLVYSNAGHNAPVILQGVPGLQPSDGTDAGARTLQPSDGTDAGARRLQPSGVRRLTSGGPILGTFSSASFDEGVVEMRSGDALVMFTDGLTEARNVNDEEFGESRMVECLVERQGGGPEPLLGHLFDAVRTFCGKAEQRDDITATVTRFR